MEHAVQAILIPAYKPDAKLTRQVEGLRGLGLDCIVVVDDGSGDEYRALFDALGVIVIRHAENRGKGEALKTGLNYIIKNMPGVGVVTCDADGQNLPADVRRVYDALAENPEALVLGVRNFEGDVPTRSIIGNTCMRALYMMVTGRRVKDTQTGLRGLPAERLRALADIGGARFEYEQNVLYNVPAMGIPIVQVDVSTVYIDNNASSHFKTGRDTLRIAMLTLKYLRPDIIRYVSEWAALALLLYFAPNITALAAPAARAVGVFERVRQGKRWTLLLLSLFACAVLPVHPVWAKLIADMVCFALLTLVGMRGGTKEALRGAAP